MITGTWTRYKLYETLPNHNNGLRVKNLSANSELSIIEIRLEYRLVQILAESSRNSDSVASKKLLN